MKKNHCIPIALFSLFLHSNCKKTTENTACEPAWQSFTELLPSAQIAPAKYSDPRHLGDKVWYQTSDGLLTSVDADNGAVQSVQIPPQLRISPSTQSDETYFGADKKSLLRLNDQEAAWETLYTTKDSESIENELDMNVGEGLLPFVTVNETAGLQTVHVCDLATRQVRDLAALADFNNQNRFRVQAQPKVFLKRFLAGNPDTLLAILIKFNSEANQRLMVYNLTRQSIHAFISLNSNTYGKVYKIDHRLALTSSGSLYSSTLVMLDPVANTELWRKNALEWRVLDGALLNISDALLGSFQKIDPQNGHIRYVFPNNIDRSTLRVFSETQYCAWGKEGTTIHRTLVFLNQEKGCEVFRANIPPRIESIDLPSVACSPEKGNVLIYDGANTIRLFRPE